MKPCAKAENQFTIASMSSAGSVLRICDNDIYTERVAGQLYEDVDTKRYRASSTYDLRLHPARFANRRSQANAVARCGASHSAAVSPKAPLLAGFLQASPQWMGEPQVGAPQKVCAGYVPYDASVHPLLEIYHDYSWKRLAVWWSIFADWILVNCLCSCIAGVLTDKVLVFLTQKDGIERNNCKR